jgi:16S rRNA (guanine966-N2)-methyltransferase
VRVVRGILKSRRFSLPKNFPSRPTTDFAKEGLFNMLENKLDLIDMDILDLCAGTGNLTFEFLSREAGKVTAVDKEYNCIQFIRKTAKEFGVDDKLETYKMDITLYLKKTNLTFDIIVADPPYDLTFHEEIAQLVFERQLLKPEGTLIIEHGRNTTFDNTPQFDSMRKFGNVQFSFFTTK